MRYEFLSFVFNICFLLKVAPVLIRNQQEKRFATLKSFICKKQKEKFWEQLIYCSRLKPAFAKISCLQTNRHIRKPTTLTAFREKQCDIGNGAPLSFKCDVSIIHSAAKDTIST